MVNLAARVTRTFADITIGTVIVLIHAAIADRMPPSPPRSRDLKPRILSGELPPHELAART